MEWFKRHSDTIMILGSFAVCFWVLNEKINTIEKDTAIIKTELIMKNIMPQELSCKECD